LLFQRTSRARARSLARSLTFHAYNIRRLAKDGRFNRDFGSRSPPLSFCIFSPLRENNGVTRPVPGRVLPLNRERGSEYPSAPFRALPAVGIRRVGLSCVSPRSFFFHARFACHSRMPFKGDAHGRRARRAFLRVHRRKRATRRSSLRPLRPLSRSSRPR